MRKTESTDNISGKPFVPRATAALGIALCAILALQGCFDPVYPQLDREARVMEALVAREAIDAPPSPLQPAQAVLYALANNLDAKVAEIEIAYQSESAVAARRRLLPSLNLRYSMDHSNHPSARWSESTRSGNQSLESSYSSDPNSRHGEVGVMWNLIDFGVGYLKSRQQEERIRYSNEQQRRVRQQVVLDVLTHYWRTAAAVTIAAEAETLRKDLNEQADAIRDSVEMRILTGAEGARRELAVHGGLAELEQWRRAATQAKLELGRVMGCGNALGFELADFPVEPPEPPPLPDGDPSGLQAAALQRRPELFQYDAQERIAVDEARLALLQMAPNANLSLSVHDDPDKFLEWENWMTVGARVSWNLFNIPARLSERRMAKLQGETAKQKGLALAAAIMAQVGIAYSEWSLSYQHSKVLSQRAAARLRLVEALAAGERDGQTRPGEVLQERVRLLSEKAAALRAAAEARVAGARLANAIGMEVDERGRLLWSFDGGREIDLLAIASGGEAPQPLPAVKADDAPATKSDEKKPEAGVSGEQSADTKVVKAEDFLASSEYFGDSDKQVSLTETPEPESAGAMAAATTVEDDLRAMAPDGESSARAEPAGRRKVGEKDAEKEKSGSRWGGLFGSKRVSRPAAASPEKAVEPTTPAVTAKNPDAAAGRLDPGLPEYDYYREGEYYNAHDDYRQYEDYYEIKEANPWRTDPRRFREAAPARPPAVRDDEDEESNREWMEVFRRHRPEDIQALRGASASPKTPETESAKKSPDKGEAGFEDVKKLPFNSFIGPKDMPGVKIKEADEAEKRQALEPLTPLGPPPEEPSPTLENAGMLGGDTLRPNLRPPLKQVEPGSLRPPS